MKKIKLVVSDFHLGTGPFFRDGTQNILEDFFHDEEFISFLEYYSSGDYRDCAVELVINGDFLNLLQVSHFGVHSYVFTESSTVQALHQIIAGHSQLFDGLKRFANAPQHKIIYVLGNHDQGMCFPKAQKLFSDRVGSKVDFYLWYYERDSLRIEHGHMHEWVTKIPKNQLTISKGLPEPILNLPWGSVFTSELLPRVKMERQYIDKVKPFRRLIVWMLLHDTLFALKTGLRVLFFALSTILRRSRYKFMRPTGSLLSLLKDVTIYPIFDYEARHILEKRPHVSAVIMGHTHVLRYRRFRGGTEYFNIGTWNEATSLSISNLGTFRMLTYAYVEIFENDPKPRIRLKEWKGFWRPEVLAAI